VLSRLPALRSRDEFGAGRWPKHCVAALASVFFAFGETLNLAVLVAGTETSVQAVMMNITLRLTTGVGARVCIMWRLKRWVSRRLGRKLSYNPSKMCRRATAEQLGPKTRNRVSAIFLGNKAFAGYTPLIAWLVYDLFGISFGAWLARDPCASLELMPSFRASRQWPLFGLLLGAEMLEDVLVKIVHARMLPCVTRRVLAPTFFWSTLQCSCQLFFALSGFESAGRLLRADELLLTRDPLSNATLWPLRL